MFVRRLTSASGGAAAATASPSPSSMGAAPASWSQAIALVANSSTPANQAAALSFLVATKTTTTPSPSSSSSSFPSDAARRLISHCVAHQRYSNDAFEAAFPQLCDASRVVGEPSEPCADVLRRAMGRNAYVDAAAISGPFLRLVNAASEDPMGDLHVNWSWMRHTRAKNCPVARSAIVDAYASFDLFTKARVEEGAMRKDGVLLREEGLVGMLRAWPAERWNEALSTVKHWRAEHRVAETSVVDRAGNLGVHSVVELVRVLASARKFGTAARVLLAATSKDTELVGAMTTEQLGACLAAVLPAWSPASATMSEDQLGTREDTDDLIKSLLLSARLAAEHDSFMRAVENATETEDSDSDLAGYICAGAAILKDRGLLTGTAQLLIAKGVTQPQFDRVLRAVVEPLRGAAWQVGKLAVAELVRATKLEAPADVRSRLLVLHQAVEDDKGVVLDALFGKASA